MKLFGIIKIPVEININHVPVFYKNVEVGKIINSKCGKNGQATITVEINSKKKKLLKELTHILKGL
jgi:paraquat-inducible protein B